MYGLTLYEPWGMLIMLGEKEYETRSFSVKHRGPLLIHTSKRADDLKEIYREHSNAYRDVLVPLGFTSPNDFTLGAALGIVDVVDCLPTDQVRDYISKRELGFGNYAPKRFAWKLANPRRFETPIPMKGMQGLFVVDPLLLPAVREQMIIWHEMYGEGVKECEECHHVAAARKDIVHDKECSKAQEGVQG